LYLLNIAVDCCCIAPLKDKSQQSHRAGAVQQISRVGRAYKPLTQPYHSTNDAMPVVWKHKHTTEADRPSTLKRFNEEAARCAPSIQLATASAWNFSPCYRRQALQAQSSRQ